MISIVNFAGERDPFAVGRPTRLIVRLIMIGNLRELFAVVGVDNPDICVAILFILFAGAIRNESDAPAVGRPLGIAIVPVVAMRDRSRFAGFHVNDPKVCAPVIKPTGVVEFV